MPESKQRRPSIPVVPICYRPTPKQELFHASRANEVLFGGAAGGGKSKALVMDALARCLCWPGTQAYIFRRSYPELRDTVIAEALASYPAALGGYAVTRHDFRLRCGSAVHFRHCAGPQDMFAYSGVEIHWLYFDELTTFEREVYDFLKTRLRAKASLGIVPVVRCASNPGNIGHAWVKRHFVDAGPFGSLVPHKVHSKALGRTHVYTTQYIPSLATENPHIGADYIFELEKKPEALRRALLYGQWDAFEGQVFVEFTDDPSHYADGARTHVLAPFDIPLHWPRYRSFDFGYSRPFAVGWWAVDPDGRVYRYREWYGCSGVPNEGVKLQPGAIAQGILEMEAQERREGIRFTGIADPSIFDVSRGESIADLMMREGVYFQPGDNARLSGKMQLHKRLAFDEAGKPGLYVFSTCRNFLRTVPNLAYDPRRAEDVDSEGEDHIYDETRYFLMARPCPGRLPAPSRPALWP